jgi:hypothetical protein
MQWVTTYSPTHRQLFEWFVAHLPIRPGDTLAVAHVPQLCESGTYYDAGWKAQTTRKIDALIGLTSGTPSSGMIACLDVDITVFRHFEDDVAEHMKDAGTEFMFQDDGLGGLCSGLMLFANPAIATDVLKSIRSRLPEAEGDQKALNQVIERSDAIVLPHHVAWTYGLHGLGEWKPGDIPRSPRGLAVHHANWTRGIENKMMLLRAVVAEQTEISA